MASREELQRALIAAHAEGNTRAAQILADRLQQMGPRVSRPEAIWRGAQDMFLAGLSDEMEGAEVSARKRFGDNPLYHLVPAARTLAEMYELTRRLGRDAPKPGDVIPQYDLAGDAAEQRKQQELEAAQADRPVSTMAGQVVGGIGQSILTRRLPVVNRLQLTGPNAMSRGNLVRAGITGGAGAGAYAFGSANNQSAQDRLAEVPSAVAMGTALGVATPFVVQPIAHTVGNALAGVSQTAQGLWNRFQTTPADRAVRLIDRALQRGDVQPQDLVTRSLALGRQGGPIAESIAEVGGTGTQGLGRAVNTVPGPGQQVARDFLTNRSQTMGDRVMAAVRRVTGRNPDNAGRLLEQIETGRRAAARPLYTAGYARDIPAEVSDQLAQYVQGDIGQQAAAVARRIAESAQRSARTPSEIADAALAVRIIDDAVAGRQVQWTPRALDYLQRGYRDISDGLRRSGSNQLAVGVDAVRGRVLDAIEQNAPEVTQAMRIWRDGANATEALETGRRLLSMPGYEIEAVLNRASQFERDAMMMGLAEALARRVNANDSAAVNTFLRDRNIQRALSLAFDNPTTFRQFMSRLSREQTMQRTSNKVLAQSETTDKRQEVFDATDGESELSFLNDVMRNGTPVTNVMLRLAAEAWARFNTPGIRNPEVHREVALRLWRQATRGNAQAVANEITALRQQRAQRLAQGFQRPMGEASRRVVDMLLPSVPALQTEQNMPERVAEQW